MVPTLRPLWPWEQNPSKFKITVKCGLVQDSVDIRVKLILFFMAIREIWKTIRWLAKNIYGPNKTVLWKFTEKRKNLGLRHGLSIQSFQVSHKYRTAGYFCTEKFGIVWGCQTFKSWTNICSKTPSQWKNSTGIKTKIIKQLSVIDWLFMFLGRLLKCYQNGLREKNLTSTIIL